MPNHQIEIVVSKNDHIIPYEPNGLFDATYFMSKDNLYEIGIPRRCNHRALVMEVSHKVSRLLSPMWALKIFRMLVGYRSHSDGGICIADYPKYEKRRHDCRHNFVIITLMDTFKLVSVNKTYKTLAWHFTSPGHSINQKAEYHQIKIDWDLVLCHFYDIWEKEYNNHIARPVVRTGHFFSPPPVLPLPPLPRRTNMAERNPTVEIPVVNRNISVVRTGNYLIHQIHCTYDDTDDTDDTDEQSFSIIRN
jgi:hypothetical protein